jgi:hypothetical protein
MPAPGGGAPGASPAYLPATNPSASVAPPPAAGLPPGKPSPVLKIVLIVVGVFVILGVLGVASCVFLLHRAAQRIKVNEARNGGSISINTPGGEVKIGSRGNPSAPIAGIPVYPGAKPVEQGAQMTFGNAGGFLVQAYETDDPIEQVVSFYKEHLGNKLGVVENEGHYRMGVTNGGGDASSTTTIDVETDRQTGKTKITIAHIGK